MKQSFKSHITEIRDALVVQHDHDGLERRSSSQSQTLGPPTADDEIAYLLTDQQGKFLAGNIELIPRFEGWKELPWTSLKFIGDAEKSKATDALYAFWSTIEGRLSLGGRGAMATSTNRKICFWKGLLWSIADIFDNGHAWKCLARLGCTAPDRCVGVRALASVAQGQLATRVPLSSSNDDLDHVAGRINSTLDQLQRTVTTLEQISSDIAHDLKTPISRIQQRVHTALAAVSFADRSQSALVEIRDELDGVVATFEALLRIAQIESGARKARFADIDIDDVVAKVVEAYEYVGEDTNHAYHSNHRLV